MQCEHQNRPGLSYAESLCCPLLGPQRRSQTDLSNVPASSLASLPTAKKDAMPGLVVSSECECNLPSTLF